MIANAVYQAIKNRRGNRFMRASIRGIACTPAGGVLAAIVLAGVSVERRRAGAFYLMKNVTRAWPQRNLIQGGRAYMKVVGGERAAEVYWLLVGFSARPDRALALLDSKNSSDDLHAYDKSANLRIASAVAHYHGGNFRASSDSFAEAHELEPETLQFLGLGLQAAHANGQICDLNRAMANYGRYYNLVDVEEELENKTVRGQFESRFLERAASPLVPRLLLDRASGVNDRRYGVFFHSSTEALGHAILDPYYFLALRRAQYDYIAFVGPDRHAYRPASAVCSRIVAQYGDIIETGDDALLNASWMHFGTLSEGPVDLCVENYWSLLREAVHRTRDASDPFVHNAWHLKLPETLERRGRKFAEILNFLHDKPLVVLHARHNAYHRLGAQAFRDARIENYIPAIEYLLSSGYQVIRIGDRAMPRLGIRHENYLELPFHKRYRPEYDPYFIANAAFMIGCQSGPCAYARALGVPLLSVNAVLHYTLLPSRMEMACFKRYERRTGRHWTGMSLEDALTADVQHFDNAYEFLAAGIRVRDAESAEIQAAVEDMIDWLADPEKPMTGEQTRFHSAVEAKCMELTDRGTRLAKPIADYLGIALPGYRIAPSVAKMRAGADGGGTVRNSGAEGTRWRK